MQRTLIKNIKDKVGETILLSGWVDIRRDHGKLIFIDLRDTSGKVQMVVLPIHEDAHKVGSEVRNEWVVEVEGIVNQRPEKMVNADQPLGAVEIEVLSIKVLAKAEEMPFEKGCDMNLDTYLNHLPLTLRDDKKKAIFKVQATVAKAFRDFFSGEDFTEIQAPKIIGEDAEGGANSFSFDYFDHTAHLAQSPQFYKQIMVGVFEKVFSIGNVYRAEKHSTTRHLNEYTSLDIEMGFIKDHEDIMKMETKMLSYICGELKKNNGEEFKLLGVEVSNVPDEIPALKLREAQEIIKKEHGVDCGSEPDLEPQHERWITEYAQREHGSDFIFITHFPMSKRPMYTYEDENDQGYAKGFDLLFKGIEITTGGQRVHEYDKLVVAIKGKDLDPEKFAFYLQAFKYGMPPHGGFGMGLERLTAKLLNLANVKEATLFPRDLNRIDTLLSE